jgi:formamidopyrimidine-DNA glycosylase
MPELPEVENVKISLERQGLSGQVFSKVELNRPSLRTRLRSELRTQLPGQQIKGLQRRAKFQLMHTQDFVVLSHLGMTGSWRFVKADEALEKHDHLVLRFASGKCLVYNDPRRFGVFELVRRDQLSSCRWLKHLGLEPLSHDFTGDSLFNQTRKRSASIKAFLMDQRQVVGVGNIYASEALFASGIRPSRQAGRLTRVDANRLVVSIKSILGRAIQSGGSTIRDYRNSDGESGRFQALFKVYNRAGEACTVCGNKIQVGVIAGRSTYWCRSCQR